MRTTTAGELTVLASPTRQYTYRVKVENGSGTMIDLSSWVHHISRVRDIDQPVSSATVYFVRADSATQSLSPLRSDSTLNREDDLITFNAQLKPGRRITIECATTAVGAAVLAGDYKLLFSGKIDAVNFEDNPVGAICRDEGGLLVDRWIGAGWPTYQEFNIYGTTPGVGTVTLALGSAVFSTSQAGVLADGYTITVNDWEYIVSAFNGTTGATLTAIESGAPIIFTNQAFTINAKEIETVIQEILDDTVNGGSILPVSPSVTLNTPVSPVFFVTEYKQQNQSVMEALQTLAEVIGWDIRYVYDETSGTFLLTLSEPPRSKTTPDYTFGPGQYFRVSRLNVDRTKVRNFIDIHYYNRASHGRSSYQVGDGPSQAAYELQYMRIDEPDSSPINTFDEAVSKATAILADLKEPKAEQEIELPFFWPAELGDLYRHSPNGIHYNHDEDYAVVRIEDDLSPGAYRTRLTTRGAPAGKHVSWFPPPKPTPIPVPTPIYSNTGEILFDPDGLIGQFKSGVKDSTGSPINLAFHKGAVTDPDTLDSVPDGTTYSRTTPNEKTGGARAFSYIDAAGKFSGLKFIGTSGTPGLSIPTGPGAMGTGPTGTIVGTDSAGFIQTVVGTSPAATGDICTVTFDVPYTTAPFVVVVGASSGGVNALAYSTSVSTTGFTIHTTQGYGGAGAHLDYYYIVLG